MTLNHEWKLLLFPWERNKRWTGKQVLRFKEEGVGWGYIVNSGNTEDISLECRTLECYRKTFIIMFFVLLGEASIHSPLGQLPLLVAYVLSGSWDFVLDLLGWEKKFNEESPKVFVTHQFVTVLTLCHTYALAWLASGLGVQGNDLWVWELTLPPFLPPLSRNGLTGTLWDLLASGIKPLLWESRKVFSTLLQREAFGHWKGLNWRGKGRMKWILSTQIPTGSCSA